MVLLLVLGPSLLPEYRDPNAGRVDLLSVAQSLLAVLSSIYGLKQLAEQGPEAMPLLFVAIGIVLGTLFVRRQRRLDYPLLDLALFRQPRFSAAIAAYGLSGLAMFGVYIFITQYLQLVLNLSPLQAGLATVPWALAFVVGSLFAPKLATRLQPVSVLVWGLLASAVGFGMLTLSGTSFGLAVLVVAMVIMGLGLAPVFTIGNEMIITAAPPERAGAASAISETCAEFSGALGIAVVGSIGMALYRVRLGAAMPAGVPEDVAGAALATPGGAVGAGQALPDAMGEALLAAARNAFIDALQFTAVVGAAIVVGAALLSARILRQRAQPAEESVRRDAAAAGDEARR
jgi:DHA2 family multidrug resistance protein-like MFS transporter